MLQAGLILKARRRARVGLTDYSRYVAPDELPVAHHQLVCDTMDRVFAGELNRVIIMMPPGSAKSTYATVRAPAYLLGRYGKKGVISASYNDTLAEQFGRKVRNLVASEAHQEVFPNSALSPDSRAKGEWETTEGGFYFACGVGSGVTGRRADVIIVDDPIKSRQEADSKLIRDKTWQWYTTDLRTRGKPGYAIVLIQTRWHEDDLAGRILPEKWAGESGYVTARDGEQWFVLCVPAQAAANDPLGRAVGEWLWPEYMTADHWRLTKQIYEAESGSIRDWNALYQQRPTAEDGIYFRREWFEGRRFKMGDQPTECVRYMSIDGALSEEKGADSTEIAEWDVDQHGNIYAVNWWTGQKNPSDWVDTLIDRIAVGQPIYLVYERANLEQTALPFLMKRMQERGIMVATHALTSHGDKQAKTQSFQAMQSSGRVYWPLTTWAERVIDQLLRFPAGKHDDCVDACGNMGRFLAWMWAANPPKPKPKTFQDAWNAPIVAADMFRLPDERAA